jgi:hypothetical protein
MFSFAALLILLACGAASAAEPPKIGRVRVGLPGGKDASRSRNGTWTPVYVTLEATAEGNPRDAWRLAVESTDGEEVPYRTYAAVHALSAGEKRVVLAYVRPGSDSSEFAVKLLAADGKAVQTVPRIRRDTGVAPEVIHPQAILYLTLGDRLPGLRRALSEGRFEITDSELAFFRDLGVPEPTVAKLGKLKGEIIEGEKRFLQKLEEVLGKKELIRWQTQLLNNSVVETPEEGGRRIAGITDVSLLPDRWYGYAAADVVVLATGNDSFVRNLLEEKGESTRCDALLEWVRRGGRLVVSVGRNHQLVGRLLKEKLRLLDCDIQGSVSRSSVSSLRLWGGREAEQLQPLGADKDAQAGEDEAKGKEGKGVEIACLRPGAGVHTALTEEADANDLQARPIIVEGSCGLGHVVLVAFDLDAPPFTDWEGQAAFWKKMQADVAPRQPAAPKGQSGELADELQRCVETYGELPVISFGWVALFLLGYIFLVGPLDYFLLKKVFKRLELTWVTFPAVVLTVSVAAYLTAYYLKGDELWTNKVDLVDIDLHGPRQVYGTTWFSLFNPRGQAFSIGLEPASPGWSAPPKGVATAALVAPMDTVQRTVSGSPGLFRRPYEYAEEGGLRGLPIPVWAARSFVATWRAPAGEEPPIEADVRLSRDGAALVGSIVNRLPIELQYAALFYRGEWFPLGTLVPGQPLQVQSLFERGAVRKALPEWFQFSWAPRDSVAVSDLRSRPGVLSAQLSYQAIKPLMFYGASGTTQNNSGLRQLDQGWRLAPRTTLPAPPQQQFRDEVILVGRMPSLTGKAEAITAGPGSPSRLWLLGALPDTGAARKEVPGHLSQETYVRVYIPVQK